MTDHEGLIEEMAESAHNAWMEAYRQMGYTSRVAAWGEEFMVPFSELSERGKDLDRVIMRSILNTLDSLGYRLTKGAMP